MNQRPLLTTVVSAAFVFLTIFDNSIIVTDIPFLRNPAAFAGVAVLLLYAAQKRLTPEISSYPQLLAIIFLFVGLAIELYHTSDANSGIGQWGSFLRFMQWAQAIVLFIILVDVFRDPAALPYIACGFLAAMSFMVISTVLGIPFLTSVGYDRYGEREGFFGLNLNQQAFLYGLTTISMNWYMLTSWPRIGFRYFAAICLMFLSMYLMFKTGSRSAFLVTIAGTAYIGWACMQSRNISVYIVVFPLICVGATWLFFETETLQRRLIGALENQSYSGRDYYFWICWDLVKAQPWLGYGTESVFLVGDGVGGDGARSSHNGVFQVLLTFGIIGFVIYACLLYNVMIQLWRVRGTEIGKLFIGLFIASICFHLFADMAFNKYYWILLALAVNVEVYVWRNIVHPKLGAQSIRTSRRPQLAVNPHRK